MGPHLERVSCSVLHSAMAVWKFATNFGTRYTENCIDRRVSGLQRQSSFFWGWPRWVLYPRERFQVQRSVSFPPFTLNVRGQTWDRPLDKDTNAVFRHLHPATPPRAFLRGKQEGGQILDPAPPEVRAVASGTRPIWVSPRKLSAQTTC